MQITMWHRGWGTSVYSSELYAMQALLNLVVSVAGSFILTSCCPSMQSNSLTIPPPLPCLPPSWSQAYAPWPGPRRQTSRGTQSRRWCRKGRQPLLPWPLQAASYRYRAGQTGWRPGDAGGTRERNGRWKVDGGGGGKREVRAKARGEERGGCRQGTWELQDKNAGVSSHSALAHREKV